ncbi:hypothetical protein [Sutcliffiella rhizosphaerae]|uniref:Lipoprotein n=1 Tax=Sutcliffiella rhizosphaerae TaxID=2880967 RepID=A0ABM8YUY1_9BACI|nr:hypothetical protein [Sutcliffiella rhizosphaerae]CAG9623759.1 hypothetical protein BACCIP111883_04593 [Sutcliffiella rhizosphaerae]
MRKNIIISFLFVLLLTGCSNLLSSANNKAKFERLLSDDEYTYSLFIASPRELITLNILEENNITNVSRIQHEELQYIDKEYKFLKINRSPSFLVFDNKEMIYMTENQSDLVNFLQNTKNKE